MVFWIIYKTKTGSYSSHTPEEYCNVDGQSHARPDRDMPVATQPLGCDVTQQESEVGSVTGCYATLDKQVSLRARQ
jgi:hypothetical protein